MSKSLRAGRWVNPGSLNGIDPKLQRRFFEAYRAELAPHGVRVNAVSPGVIATPFHEQFSTAEAMKNYAAAIPLGRVGQPGEAAQTIAFLASDAASYLCGETIEINGGMLMD